MHNAVADQSLTNTQPRPEKWAAIPCPNFPSFTVQHGIVQHGIPLALYSMGYPFHHLGSAVLGCVPSPLLVHPFPPR